MNTRLIILLCAVVAGAHCSTIKNLFSRINSPSSDSTKLGIYDGSKTTIKDHPHVAALLLCGVFFCEATIVSESWVVTIGDCVSGISPSDLSIVVGSEDGVKGKNYSVTDVIAHPKYGTEEFDYDYACIKVKGKFKWSDKVKAIQLPKKEAKPNTIMVIAGWGSTSSVNSEDEPNGTLLQGNMTWLPKKKCEKTYKPFGITWTSRMACAYNKGKTTLCTGDWADAFVNNGVFYGMFVAGGTSGWCSSEAVPILLSNIYPVAEWIAKTTGATFYEE